MKINVFMIFLISSFFVLSNICFAEINKDWLRRDETLALDEITLKFNNFCKPLPDTRTLGLGLDLLRFLDSEGRLLFTIDIGTEEGRYYLGEGWYGNEDWGNLTECWSNALAVKSRIYCYIPENSIYMELVCTTACNPINTEVTLNGQKIGEFSLPANSGFRTISIDLPKGFGRYMEYTLKSGGPLQISHLELIDSNGDVFSKIYSLCELAKPGDTAKFPVQISKGIGDLSLYLLKPAQNDSILKFTINNANSIFFQIPTGSDYADTTIKDALERQGDRKTQTSGWGEDFNARNSFTASSYNCPSYPQVAYDGGSVGLLLPDQCNSMFVKLDLSKPLLLSEYPYLSLKIKVTKGDLYYIRPEGFDAQGNFVLLWYEDAATDDRRGTGNWETLTINLPELAKLAGTGGISISSINFPLVKTSNARATMEFDWVRIHKGFIPNPKDIKTNEVVFNNNLDDDNDGLVDRDDEKDYSAKGFSQPLVLAYYHPWFGSPYSTTGHWSGWNGEKLDYTDPDNPPKSMGIMYNPDDFDPKYPGKRFLSCPYYPMNFWDYPDYEPPKDGKYRYDIYGGVEKYDCNNPEFVEKEIALAKKYGIDGFIMNTGGFGSFENQIRVALDSALKQKQFFWVTVIYDWYYRLPAFGLMQEKTDYSMALDLMLFQNIYGTHPRYLQFDNRPVVFASFLSHLVSQEKWLGVKDIVINPEKASFSGIAEIGGKKPGFSNLVEFQFAKAEKPQSQDQRILSVAFDVIRLLDKNLKTVSILDIGTEAASPHLLYGWSNNETWSPGQTMVWAAGAERKAALEIEIPDDATFLEISCISFPEQNSITMKINNGEPLVFPVQKRMTTFLFRLGNSDDDTTKNIYENDKMPIAMFLDSREATVYFDGFASYGSFLGSNRVIVSDPSPTILTVGCGYDDRKIRYPGAFTDREDGMLYRRQWEKALEGRPDIILINTWNEWGEGTIIEPTVEFGYKYLEITLTYSLIFQGKMSTSAKPINTGLTIYKYHGTDQGDWDISFSSEKQNKISFYNLSLPEEANINCQVFKDDQPYKDFTLNSKDKILQIDTQNSKSIYKIQIRKVVSSCIKGDLDRDGKITSKDVIILLQIATGLIKPTTYQECSADANNDGKISANDAIITLRRSVGLLAPGNRPYNMYSTISIDEFYGQIGDEIIVPLNIDNAKNFAGGDICITYDNKVLAPLDIIPDKGILLAGNTSELGIIRISYVNPENLDSKILAKIKFRVISDNTSPLMLSEASLYQNDNQPSVMKKINGKFTPLILRPICNELLQNFPNPFNPETWIPYSINEDREVTIKIYEATGKLVRRLDLGFKPAGSYKTKDKAVYWDGSNDNGEKVASGVYFYNIETANFSITRKMIILK